MKLTYKIYRVGTEPVGIMGTKRTLLKDPNFERVGFTTIEEAYEALLDQGVNFKEYAIIPTVYLNPEMREL